MIWIGYIIVLLFLVPYLVWFMGAKAQDWIISIAFLIEEFIDFCNEMDEIRSKLMSDPRFVVANATSGNKSIEYLTRNNSTDDEDYN